MPSLNAIVVVPGQDGEHAHTPLNPPSHPHTQDGHLTPLSQPPGSVGPLPSVPTPNPQMPPMSGQPPNSAPPGVPTSQQDAHFMQQQSQIFVFSTALANKASDAVQRGQCKTIIDYHLEQPGTKTFLQVGFFVSHVACPKSQLSYIWFPNTELNQLNQAVNIDLLNHNPCLCCQWGCIHPTAHHSTPPLTFNNEYRYDWDSMPKSHMQKKDFICKKDAHFLEGGNDKKWLKLSSWV